MMRVLLAVAFLFSSSAVAIEIKKDELAGTWEYVSSYNQLPNGMKKTLFGKHPKGQFVISADGTYNHIIMHPKTARTLAHYGTYTVDEKAGTFTGHVKHSNDRKLNGKKQVRTVTVLDGENLHYTNHLSIAGVGARVIAVLRRVRP